MESNADGRQVPIPPLSVVRVAHKGRGLWFRRHNGRIFRVGYYSRQDGLDCIWLVNDEGKYEQTVDHDFLYRRFDVVQFADHVNWYGRRRKKIPPIRPADGTRGRKRRKSKG